jgi:hypothetical protein
MNILQIIKIFLNIVSNLVSIIQILNQNFYQYNILSDSLMV